MSATYTAGRASIARTPAFSVKKLDGVFTKTIAVRDPKGYGLEFKEVEAPLGWEVSFPSKHGNMPNRIHVETKEELHRLGFDGSQIPLVDEDGETIGMIPNVIPTVVEKGKRRAEANA